MTDDAASKKAILSKLAQSRAEIRRVLEPKPRVRYNALAAGSSSVDVDTEATFPRSRTMRMLLSGKGLGTTSAIVGGLLMARPSLAFKLLRMVPKGAVARMLMVKAVSALRSRD